MEKRTRLPKGLQPDTILAVPIHNRILLCCIAVITVFLESVAPAAACQYCRMGGDGQACLDFIKTDRSGDLRLEAAIDKYQVAPVQAAPLAIVTNASELPARTARRPAAAAAPASSLQTHVLDGGLIGLALAGGIFCWRTRRPGEGASERP